MAINYASYFGIESLPAAVIFAILYFAFFIYFFSKAVARPIYVYIVITLFCARTSFLSLTLRMLTRSDSPYHCLHPPCGACQSPVRRRQCSRAPCL